MPVVVNEFEVVSAPPPQPPPSPAPPAAPDQVMAAEEVARSLRRLQARAARLHAS